MEVCGVVTEDWDAKTSDVPEGVRRQWRADRALRPAMRSPGRPDPSRVVQRQFWRLIATGVTTAEASLTVGVSWPVGTRWYRHAGGMPPICLREPTGRYLTFEEREEIAILRAKGAGVREIARALERDPGTISRELRRNAATRGGRQEYRATVAQWKAQQSATRPKVAKLVTNDRLREYVQQRLDGTVRRADGTVVTGPDAAEWKGRKMKPHRADRHWATAWSPQQISNRLRIDFPDDESMRISHEALYQSLFIEGRGALKRELVACLRTGRALREPRARTRNKPQGHVTADVVLSARPAEAADRAVPGHWEGDLIIGTGRSAIGTLVERSSRSTLLVHLPRQAGWGEKPVVKNGPALAGYGAVAMNAALAASMTALPEQLRKTLTWDRGKELSRHAQFTLETGTKVFFADPHSPWQRPTNENTNGLLRQYFPKGTDLSRWNADDLEAVALAVNNRPRKVLDWKTPAEVFNEQLQLLEQGGVATTG
ncbi:IS30 family transposase [Brevibacterium antiquum]|uniref:IS30 family transposase n=1 Tax=Brevibacterium antiquum TaxID=234835 RepID=UPI003AEFCA55